MAITLNGTTGITTPDVNSTGGLTVDNDGATVATFDRATSDGAIVDLQKDGAAVGSIGVFSNGGTDYLTMGKSDTGILFDPNSDVIQAWNTSTNLARDGAIDIGISGARFKDLMLSGGVYLGGTGAANYLDDYEEGTFTLAITDGTLSKSATGNYTKVGSLVYIRGGIQNIESGGAFTGTVYMTGLPFTPLNSSFISSFINYTSTSTSWVARAGADGAVRFYRYGSSGLDNEELDGGDVGTYTDVLIGGCYDT